MLPRQPLLASIRTVARRGHRPPPVRPSPSQVESQAGPSTSTCSANSQIEEASSSGSESGSEGWYYVNRSQGGELPVYSKYRNGGSVTTILRKVEGDAKTLQSQLNEYFHNSHIDPFTHPPKVTVRPTNGHLQIKGHWVEEVKGWLEERGF